MHIIMFQSLLSNYFLILVAVRASGKNRKEFKCSIIINKSCNDHLQFMMYQSTKLKYMYNKSHIISISFSKLQNSPMVTGLKPTTGTNHGHVNSTYSKKAFPPVQPGSLIISTNLYVHVSHQPKKCGNLSFHTEIQTCWRNADVICTGTGPSVLPNSVLCTAYKCM